MYPGYWHPGFHRYYRRGPSRLLWFALGAGTVLFYFKHRLMSADENRFGFCRRIHSLRSSQQTNDRAAGDTHGGPSIGWGPRDQQWEGDKARLMDMHMGQQVNAAMSEASEATLDSVLNIMTSLKARLAQHRAERERMHQHKSRSPVDHEGDNFSRRVV